MRSENLLPTSPIYAAKLLRSEQWALKIKSCLCVLLILSLMSNFEANFVPVLITLYVSFAGMTDFKVFRKDFSFVSPTLPL